jgi:alanyl-tRNA synthetase
MQVDDLRESYLDYFATKGHVRVASDSLVPQNDPTLLFTGAGMNQFKDNFLGVKKGLRRATSSQKCLRTGDLENVGKTAFHHSFFEMLGNFSFGDYFKEEAITWAWEYLTQVLKISPQRLRISIHESDDEAFGIWKHKIGIRESWIYRLGDKSNFWPSNAPTDGPNGPCGPCSEIYFDQYPDMRDEDIESQRFAEIWNLVFTQFDRRDGGTLVPLAQKNIDTGMGLERLACVMQGKKTNFEIDIFQPIHTAIISLLKMQRQEADCSGLYTVADHVRAVVFSIADGVVPSNEGRGYVIRKLIRRAIWHAHQMIHDKGRLGSFLYKIVPEVARVMKRPYPEIEEASESIAATLRSEEERFLDTLENGLRLLEQRLKQPGVVSSRMLPGESVFELYDTFGFPDELTRTISEARGIGIDQDGFERLMAEQKRRAKDATQISGQIFVTSDLEKSVAALPPTTFLGYERLEASAKVLWADLKDGKGVVLVDQTPFYAESGGQVGDTGRMQSKDFRASVVDTQKKDGRILHYIEIESGNVKTGDQLMMAVCYESRHKTMRNHTATHLLHAALRKLLGAQVRQLGSQVSPEKLRFDYSYGQPLTVEQLRMIEDMVNAQILSNIPVGKTVQSLQTAKESGALAFFGDKYGEEVRVLTISDFSKELCGGTHCDATGQIGFFMILSDASIASGTRRIEALTGEAALRYVQEMRALLNRTSSTLRATPEEIVDRIVKLQDSVRKLEKEKSKASVQTADPRSIIDTAKQAGAYFFAAYKGAGLQIQELRSISDQIRDQAKQTVYFLVAENDAKMQYILATTRDLSGLDVRPLGKILDQLLQGKSGGNAQMVQGGAPKLSEIEKLWNQVLDRGVQFLKER